MSGSITMRDFSAGWCPGDDRINGRPNGLLKMDNLELDKNGAIQLIGGTTVKWSGFPASAHSLYSCIINGTRHEYTALTDGSIYRDQTVLDAAGGDTSLAGFGTAFNFTLICSGNKRYKDDGTTKVALGVSKPTDAVNNFYTFTADLGTVPYDALGVFTIKIRRDEFDRIGSGSQDWSTVYGFRISFISDVPFDIVNVFPSSVSATDLRIRGGSNALNGTYQYLQINVNNTGSYLAKSV